MCYVFTHLTQSNLLGFSMHLILWQTGKEKSGIEYHNSRMEENIQFTNGRCVRLSHGPNWLPIFCTEIDAYPLLFKIVCPVHPP